MGQRGGELGWRDVVGAQERRSCGCRTTGVVSEQSTHTATKTGIAARRAAEKRRRCKLRRDEEKQLVKRASREMTGYHSGYTYKAQRTQKGTLDTAFQSLTYFEKNLQDKEPAAKYRRTVTKTAADFYHHTTARASTEEFNLAMNVSEHDVRQAEFIRTYRNEDFRGGALLRRYEFEKQHATKTREGQRLYDFEDVYGFRPNVDEVFYLSPWEFCMFWHAISKKDGRVYTGEEFLEFPELPNAACLREGLILCRRSRPMVPCPQNTPMPESAKPRKSRARDTACILDLGRSWKISRRQMCRSLRSWMQLPCEPRAGAAEGKRCKQISSGSGRFIERGADTFEATL